MHKHNERKKINDQRAFFFLPFCTMIEKLIPQTGHAINGMKPFICHNFNIVCHMLNEYKKKMVKTNTVQSQCTYHQCILDVPSCKWFSFQIFISSSAHRCVAYFHKICWTKFADLCPLIHWMLAAALLCYYYCCSKGFEMQTSKFDICLQTDTHRWNI